MTDSEKQTAAKLLFDWYQECFQNFYGAKPILIYPKKEIQLLKDLLTYVDFDVLKDLLADFFKIENEFYRKDAHTLLLFREDINQINAHFALEKRKRQEEEDFEKNRNIELEKLKTITNSIPPQESPQTPIEPSSETGQKVIGLIKSVAKSIPKELTIQEIEQKRLTELEKLRELSDKEA